MFLLTDITTIPDFSKEIGVGVGTVSNWMDRWAKDGNEPVKAVQKLGNVQIFLKTDLQKLAETYRRTPKAPSVDAAQHNEVVERAQRLAVENARLTAALKSLGWVLDEFDDGTYGLTSYTPTAEELEILTGVTEPVEITEYTNAALDTESPQELLEYSNTGTNEV